MSEEEIKRDKDIAQTFLPVPKEKLMRCAAYEEFGEPNKVIKIIEDRLVPSIEKNQVLIQVFASSINPIDLVFMNGLFHPLVTTPFPFIPGFDVKKFFSFLFIFFHLFFLFFCFFIFSDFWKSCCSWSKCSKNKSWRRSFLYEW